MRLLICLDLLLFFTGVSSDNFYFTSSPQSQDVEEGKSLRLQCRVTPNKDIHYSWTRNGRKIVPNSRVYLESGSDLVIRHVDRDLDGGKYQCRALNQSSKFNSATKDAQVNIYWMSPYVSIELVRPESHDNIKQDSEVIFRCNVQANPPVQAANIIWFFNSKEMKKAQMIPQTEIQMDGTLKIVKFQVFHSGVYHCRVIHPAGKLHSRPPYIIALATDGKTVNPNITGADFIKFAKKHTKVELTCPNIMKISNAVAVWGYMSRLGDQHRPISSLQNARLNDRGDVLTITDMQSDYANLYTCEFTPPPAVTPNVMVRTTFFLFEVQIAEMVPVIRDNFSPRVEGGGSYVVRTGEDLAIRFYIDLTPRNSFRNEKISNPPPNIRWFDPQGKTIPFLEDILISKAPRIHVLYKRHLILSEAVEEDSGEYRIEVENMADKTSLIFNVVVTFTPVFLKTPPPNQNVDEDDPVTLSCQLEKYSSWPTSRIYWEKNKEQVKTNTPDLIFSKDSSVIKIVKAKQRHSGVYQCFVQTDGYDAVFSNEFFELSVLAKLSFAHELKTKFLELNVQGRIPCKVEGHGQKKISWKRVLQSGHLDDIRPPNQVEGGSLILQYVQQNDAGRYMCIATSDYKDSRINMTVEVVVGESPKISKISLNQTVREGAPVVLSCQATGSPPPQISWIQKSGNIMTSLTFNGPPGGLQIGPGVDLGEGRYGNQEKARREVFRNGSLVIRMAQLADEAEYFCVAANSYTMKTQRGVYLRVLTAEEYMQLTQGDGMNMNMVKTIVIVVSCAVAYLGLIIGLTIFCSMRMIRNRRKRAEQAKNRENGQLMTHVNGNRSTAPSNATTMPVKSYLGNGGVMSDGGSALGVNSGHGETQQLMSEVGLPPPPPTPMDSRSHLSGVSSACNSASIYTRSQVSGASAGMLGGQLSNASPLDRLNYPRHELQTEGMLGKGEFGDVFLARARNILDREPQSLVVVKALMSREPAHVHEFHRQLDMFAKMDHDYVCRLLGVCAELEPHFIILDYCEWGDLKQFLRCMRQERSSLKIPPLTRAQKAVMCSQVAMAMEHVASMRCVHKDLAARNVLLTQDMDLKVSLLGLSRDVYAGEYFPLRERLVPLRWLAPEVIRHDEYSSASDVWAYALFVCEVFTLAEIPHSRYTDHELVQMAQNRRSIKPELPSNCPPELHDLLQRCWAEQPRDRPPFTEISMLMGELTVDADM